MRRQFEKITYADRVRDLRQRYWMLSVPLAEWTSSTSASAAALTPPSPGLLTSDVDSE